MKGKTVLVTGATDGIGRATAMALAELGARVIVHGRSASRIQQTAAEIRAHTGIMPETIEADFATLATVTACGEEILKRFPRLDVLVHNAGVFVPQRTLTMDGYETTFAVNHLAPFLLTHVLGRLIRQSAPMRIVVVSSITHLGISLDLDNLQGEKSYDGRQAYSLSKLANVMFTVELANRMRGSGVCINCLHPGVVATKLLRTGYGSMDAAPPGRGAETSIYLAASPAVEGVTGKFFKNQRESEPSPLVRDAALRARLWTLSEKLCGISPT
jgi:NAD(P)-dependent dehydrogenase (short-subunit alcohol dehydrogenase family)